jgi:hypothetical protein
MGKRSGMTFAPDRRLRRNLDRLGGRKVAKLAQRAAIAAYARPLVREAKRRVPVASGKLRASLGYQVNKQSRNGRIIVTVGPRKKFSFANTKGEGDVAIAGGGKKVDAAKALAESSGRRVNAIPPHVYAYGIEFGRTQAGKVARKTPALFLTNAFAITRGRVPREIADHLESGLTDLVK